MPPVSRPPLLRRPHVWVVVTMVVLDALMFVAFFGVAGQTSQARRLVDDASVGGCFRAADRDDFQPADGGVGDADVRFESPTTIRVTLTGAVRGRGGDDVPATLVVRCEMRAPDPDDDQPLDVLDVLSVELTS